MSYSRRNGRGNAVKYNPKKFVVKSFGTRCAVLTGSFVSLRKRLGYRYLSLQP